MWSWGGCRLERCPFLCKLCKDWLQLACGWQRAQHEDASGGTAYML